MEILILSGAFGMGHNSAAQAIKEEILLSEPNAKIAIIDMIDYIFPKLKGIIYSCFNFLVSKFSLVYNFFNRISARRASVPLKKSVVKKIDKLLGDQEVDLVISTFPLCTQYISTYKKMKNCNIPLYTYITDICSNEEWIGEKTDMYFVGSEATKEELINKGVDEKKIVVSGIPVKNNFRNKVDTDNNKNKKEVLIMGGGLGIIPYGDDLLQSLCKMEDVEITFIAGKNEKLLEEIKEEYPEINAIGYTNKVHDYMKKADLIITKAGGITLFEAIYSSTPLYVIRPFLSQEIGNARFIEESQIGKVIWTKGTDVCEDVTSLLKNDILLDDMKHNMKKTRDKLKSISPIRYYEMGSRLCY
ncbi:MAG: glycosyltransferase [Terrisporobacter sp.]